jgi:aryl-alcohol dehydrogenase-like predicted oxidoreductase
VSDQDAVPDAPPAEQAFIELAALQKEGKIKHIGTSNFGVTQLKAALSTGAKISVNQVCYNMIFRAVEFDIIPFCKANNIGVIAYSVLMQGLLTGKYATADDVPIYRARTRHFDGKRDKSRHGEGGQEELLFKTLADIKTIAAEAGVPMSDLALAWPLHMDNVCCVIAGATKASQIESNMRAAGITIAPDVLQKLNDATDALKQVRGNH